MSLEKLPEWVPEIGTIAELTPYGDREKLPFEISKISEFATAYHARVISIEKFSSSSYNIRLEGLDNTITITPYDNHPVYLQPWNPSSDFIRSVQVVLSF